MFFGMASMLAILCELQGGPAVGVFRTIDEGLAWLLGAPPETSAAADSRDTER
jgi:hypothetical protein